MLCRSGCVQDSRSCCLHDTGICKRHKHCTSRSDCKYNENHKPHLTFCSVTLLSVTAFPCFADNFTAIPLVGGGQVLVAWVANGSVAVLAWRAADNATANMVADSVQMTAATFLTGDLSNARVNNATADPFQQVLRGSSSTAGLEGVRLKPAYLFSLLSTSVCPHVCISNVKNSPLCQPSAQQLML